MSSTSTNLKKGFPTLVKKVPAPDNVSSDASTLRKAFNIVHRAPQFTKSHFSGKQNLSEYNLPDDSVQRPKCVQSTVNLDYPRYMDPPQMGVLPCGEYDASQFGPPNNEKSYDYPLGCPACGGQMILRCQLNGSGMITRHEVIHGEFIHRSFEIARFQPPANEGRVARDVALEDEIPDFLLGKKNMDDGSIDGTECDFETQKIIMDQFQKYKPCEASVKERKEKSLKTAKPNFGDVGFGSDDDANDNDNEAPVAHDVVPDIKKGTVTFPSGNAGITSSDVKQAVLPDIKKGTVTFPSGNAGITSSDVKQAVLTDIKKDTVTFPSGNPGVTSSDVTVSDKLLPRPAYTPPEACRKSLTDISLNEEQVQDRTLIFEKIRFDQQWRYGIYIDSSSDNPGFRKLEVYTPQDGRIFIDVREELSPSKVAIASDLLVFKPESVMSKNYIVKPVSYHNKYLHGRIKVRFGRDIQTDAIALTGCPLQSVDSLAMEGGSVTLWSDITGLLHVPATEIKKVMAGGIFLPIHLLRIRVAIPHVKHSTAAIMGTWKVLKIDSIPTGGSRRDQIPGYYWPAGAQRWDDVFVMDHNKDEFILASRTYPDRLIIAPVSHCRIKAEHMNKMLTAIVVPQILGNVGQWVALLAAPIQIAMQVTDYRIFNFTAQAPQYEPLPLPQEIINMVLNVGAGLQSGILLNDHPLPAKEGMKLLLGIEGSSTMLDKHRKSVFASLERTE